MLHHEINNVPIVYMDRDGKRVPHWMMIFETDNVSDQLRNGWWPEASMLRMARNILTPDSVVLDCGAHIGIYSMFLSPFVAKIHAFEAAPRTAAMLQHNVALNGYKNVEVYNVPLWDRDGVSLEVKYNPDNQGNNSCYVAAGGALSRCLDSYNFDRVDFIKIDTEGAEAMILEGARGILAKFKPYLLLEIHSWMHKSPNVYLQKIAKILNEFDYRWGINCLTRGA